MCGIAGMVVGGGAEISADALSRMERRLRHRGPDDVGFLQWRDGSEPVLGRSPAEGTGARVGLVHRRLSILDLSPSAWQPMTSGRQALVFNGEIYNYVELRDELIRSGHLFESSGDTQVLLEAYRAWGTDALRRLVGMFAFAVLDWERRSLVLARDQFGIKPLYYAPVRGGLAFASEIGALLSLPEVARKVDPSAVYDYLRFGRTDHGEATLFENIRSVPAASFMEVSLDSPAAFGGPTRFWSLPVGEAHPIPYADAVSELRERFMRNVELHLRSDVPVATALSGGIDSSSIVMAMRRLEPTQDIRTFSWIADEPSIDEERWVDVVVDAARVAGSKVTATPAEFVADLDRLIEVQGEPFGSTTIYAQYRVFALAASAGVKVMLDGQGADEALAGYRGYLGTRLASLLVRGNLATAWRLARSASRLPGVGGRSLALATANGVVPVAAQSGARRLAGEALMPDWLNGTWFESRGVSGRPPAWPRRGSDRLREKLRADLLSDSLPALLRYEDRNSMAFSIESRVPFVTPDLMTFVLSLPESYLLGDDGTTKRVFRDAMRGIVPDAILDRRDKIGFATPEQGWLASLQPWVDSTLKSDAAQQVAALRLEQVSDHWGAVLRGDRPFDWRIWRWLNLVRWSELVGADFS